MSRYLYTDRTYNNHINFSFKNIFIFNKNCMQLYTKIGYVQMNMYKFNDLLQNLPREYNSEILNRYS